MKAAVREAVAAAPEPRRPPPKLGPAQAPPLAAPPRAPASATLRPRTGWGYAIAWALGIGVGAVAAGAFVGYLVNGPPGHASAHRLVADVAPPTPDVPPPTAQEIVASRSASVTRPLAPAPTAPPAAAIATSSTTSPTTSPTTSSTPNSTTAARTVLPPIPPAKPGTQAAPPSPTARLSSNDVREVQGRLQSLGFDPGPVDGAAGPKTAAAVSRYQEAHGLQATGVADNDTLDELRREPGSMAPPPPPPRPRTQAYSYAYSPPPPRQSNPFVDALNRLFGR